MSKGNKNITPQAPGSSLVARGVQPAKQIAHEMLPSRHALSTITGGDPAQRSAGYYAKMSPADANGVGQAGVNIFSMGRNAKATAKPGA